MSVSTDERSTPPALFRALDAEFAFTLDVAATRLTSKCPRYFGVKEDGLRQSWAGERVWCNPPWSLLPAWVEKAWREARAGCPLIVMLVPDNRCHQRWWQTLVEPARERLVAGVRLTTRFLPGRPHFGTPTDPAAQRPTHPKNGCVLLVFATVAARGSAPLAAAEQLAFPLP